MQLFKYGIIAAMQSAEDEKNGMLNIVHFCGYINKPTVKDFEDLEAELNTDPEFGLVGRIGKDVFLLEAIPDMVAFFNDTLNDPDYTWRIDNE